MKRNYLLGVASAFMLMLPFSAQALVIGPATYSGSNYYIYAYGDGYTTTPTGPVSISKTATSINPSLYPGTAAATLDINATPFPSITAYSSATGVGHAAVSGSMSYQFRIESVSGVFDPDVIVPTIISYKGSVSAPTNGGATAYLDISGLNFADTYQVVAGASPSATHQINGFPQSFSGSSFDEHTVYSVIANSFYRIDLTATAVVDGLGSASAFVDPYIQIDPSFADASKYTIVLSQGIGNAVASTPIPASLAMFATALLAMGAIAYRGKRQAVVASAA
jgi:hypothetical protein